MLNEDLGEFEIPKQFVEKLLEFTGSSSSNRGFILIYVNQNGSPAMKVMCDNETLYLGLMKYFEEQIELFGGFPPPQTPEEDEEL
jgi:hypothetical protein